MTSSEYLKYAIYYEGALGNSYDPLPGMRLITALDTFGLPSEEADKVRAKILQSCRKLALMWTAGDLAFRAEREFYCSTIHESPALFGEEAVNVQYHLEALVLFARSALDIGATSFGQLLPAPFKRGRFDSFNDLLKAVTKSGIPASLSATIQMWRDEEAGWLSIIANIEKGRSLRDKLAHQMGFPIDYDELNTGSAKESAVVVLDGDSRIPLPDFIERLRVGTIGDYLGFEAACLQ